MNSLRLLPAVALGAALCALAAPAAEEGFSPLFNGKDFSGWKAFGRAVKDGPTAAIDPKESWAVVNGVLTGTGKPTGYLATEKEYGDYELKVVWRYPAGLKAGNSGVLLHCQKKDFVWPVCLEAQLRSGRAGDLWLQTAADVKLTVDPARRDSADKTMRHIWREPREAAVEKPVGEWNEYRITCRGGDVSVAVNGKTVNEGKDCNLTRGRIALQAEGTEIHFKAVEVRTLK